MMNGNPRHQDKDPGEEEEEEDPLDAYLKTLKVPVAPPPQSTKPPPTTTATATTTIPQPPKTSSLVVTFDDIVSEAHSSSTGDADSLPRQQQQQPSSSRDVDEEKESKFLATLLLGSTGNKKNNNNNGDSGGRETDNPAHAHDDGTRRSATGDDEEEDEEEEDPNDPTSLIAASVMEILATKAKTREIKLVDHASMNYAPFRRNFYIEAPDVAAMTPEELRETLFKLEIKVRGRRPNKPIAEWSQCGLSDAILGVLEREGWHRPFAVQRQAIPCIMSGRDLIGVARTGSGKTLAYLIPMLRHVHDQPKVRLGEGPIALVLAPTRELATQIASEVKKFSKALQIDCACLYGGGNVGDQLAAVRRGVEVVVGTPGRLIEVLSTRGGKSLPLSRVTFVVLDEADRLFDAGFEPQIERVLRNVRPDRQTVMFSATFPEHVASLARKTLSKDALYLVVGGGGSSHVSADVTQQVEIFDREEQKFPRLLQILGEWTGKGNVLVFCDSQEKVDDVYTKLERAGYQAVSLHGGKDQTDRDDAIKEFKAKRRTLMVATGVAGRGLDVSDLNLVINYDCPNHLEEYVHRAGRTGRAGRKGIAVTFMLRGVDDKYASDIAVALKASSAVVPPALEQMRKTFEEKVKAGTEKKRRSGYKSSRGFSFENEEESDEDDDDDDDEGNDEGEEEDGEMGLREKDASGGVVSSSIGRGDYASKVKRLRHAYANRLSSLGEGGGDVDVDALFASSSGPSSSASGAGGVGVKHEGGLVQTTRAPLAITDNKAVIVTPLQFNLNPAAAASTASSSALIKYDTTTGVTLATRQVLELTDAEKRLLEAATKKGGAVPSSSSSSANAAAAGVVGGPRHASLEIAINDLPPPIRVGITTKAAISSVEQEYRVSVTVKGTFIPAGQTPGFGERPLHMIIEAPSAESVRGAFDEINRQIRARAQRMSAEQAADHVGGGRYR